jgi:hypothetical protein
MLAHLFDPDYRGGEPPVASIDASWFLVDERPLGEGVDEATVDATITVLTGPASGYTTQTRLVFEIATGPRPTGILGTRELPLVRRSTDVSWAQIKALYR